MSEDVISPFKILDEERNEFSTPPRIVNRNHPPCSLPSSRLEIGDLIGGGEDEIQKTPPVTTNAS